MSALSARFWAALARFTRRFSLPLAVVALAALVAPFAFRLPHFRDGLTISLRSMAPRGEPSVEATYGIQERFGPGLAANARLLGVSLSAGGPPVLSTRFFASAAQALAATISASDPDELRLSDVNVGALSTSSNSPIPDAEVTAVMVGAVRHCPAESAAACRAQCSADACLLRLTAASALAEDGAHFGCRHG